MKYQDFVPYSVFDCWDTFIDSVVSQASNQHHASASFLLADTRTGGHRGILF